MAKVQVLPDQVANQIAAGEVIERPASVVKELVENSIDAGATRIEVEFRNGGTSLMRIEDNGCGMSREDALLSLERHATSKIRLAKDLDCLTTMGFRGEALPSIASVSRFQMQTRDAENEAGTEILIDGGRMLHTRDCGMPQGTRMSISKLFNTVPARRKFLKSVATEAAHIVHCVRLYALAHPNVGFTLLDDGRILFESAAGDSLKSRVGAIFGRQIANSVLEIDAEEDGMRLRGLIGKPNFSRSSRHEMLFFVNNRPVENKTLSYALVESYYGHIPKGRYPVAFLFLEIAPERVDVNVHPAKKEIRFREEAKARGFAVRTILNALKDETESLGDFTRVETKPAAPRLPKRLDEARDVTSSETPARKASSSPPPARRRLVQSDPPAPAKKAPEGNKPPAAPQPSLGKDRKVESPSEAESVRQERNWSYLGWAQGEFAVFDTGSGVVLLNVKAAQQRVLYEGLLTDFETHKVHCQKLLLAQPVELDPVSSAALEEALPFFERLGFEVAPFGRNFFRIEGVPTWLEEKDAEEFLKELVAMLRQGSLSPDKEGVAVDLIAKRAAAKVRRLREEPRSEDLDRLLERLFACQKPLTDPDGRPSLIEIGAGEIDRRFQRRNRNRGDELF
ncbi:DNA mismatch repair endonuclease MutL [Pelagicoccus sp. SDUM812003]|uniref:DNA mismatch repair endonuclease MutL n=1 Tax=Pelagicoccus sp. SDUM812003 TaxID=3041267 RepID=UPI00280DD0CA|nr:DNA mismatch repair endonuclease MutL [Pelagicoccus sp. SDUM812003]MDQ8203236.1 DNA mismatch repair endonuclease MutL [Pelagicoccus sp. SDUM812003]